MDREDNKSWWGADPPDGVTGMNLLCYLPEQEETISCVIWCPSGERLIVATSEPSIRIWKKDGSGVADGPEFCHEGRSILSLAMHPRGGHLAFGDASGNVYAAEVVDNEVSNPVFIGQISGKVREIYFTPEGTQVIAISSNCDFVRWSYPSLTEESRKRITSERQKLFCACPSADFSIFATGTEGGMIILTDAKTDSHIKTLTVDGGTVAHIGCIFDLSWHPDGRYIASAANDRKIKIWDENGRCLDVLDSHQAVVVSVAFSRDGKFLFSQGQDMKMKVWDTKYYTQFEQLNFQCQLRPEPFMSAHPILPQIISLGKNDHTARVWEVDEVKIRMRYAKIERWRDPRSWFKRLTRKLFPFLIRLDPRIEALVRMLLGAIGIAAAVATLIQFCSWIAN